MGFNAAVYAQIGNQVLGVVKAKKIAIHVVEDIVKTLGHPLTHGAQTVISCHLRPTMAWIIVRASIFLLLQE